MKKRLALALAASFVFGVAGTAFAAANPFVDVPAKHWAYDSVNKLAKAGVVDGYGDGTFRGDKTMSRYEMAQIVAKAMAKSEKADAETKALVDKLAVEFASELNNLGVRVAKLEKNASNIKFEGESRLRYSWQDVDAAGVLAKDADGTKAFDWRQRVHMNAQVSPDIKYTARLEAVGRPGDGSANVQFNRNFFTIDNKLGLDQIVVGKFGLYAGNYLAVGKTSNNDGIMIKEKLGTVDFTGFWTEQAANTDYKGAFLSKSFNKNFDMNVGYLAADANAKLTDNNAYDPAKLADKLPNPTPSVASTAWDAGVWANLGHGFNFVGEYVDTDNDGIKDGSAWAAQVSYTTGNAKAKQFFSTRDVVDKTKAHEQGFAVNYRSVEKDGLPGKGAYGQFGLNKTDFGTYAQDNVKGWWAGYQNVMQKNVLLNVEYQTLKAENDGKDKGDFATAYVQLFF